MTEKALKAFEDTNHPGNGPKFLTKLKCIERGCEESAGTMWSKYWCFKHNVERMHRIDNQLISLNKNYEAGK